MHANLRWLAAPLSGLYSAGVAIRHVLYDEHILPSYEPAIPVIGVGNLSVGGTGKTPMVEYLIRLLSKQYRVAVLSRGYGRRTKGLIIADDTSTALSIGDEPMQLHRLFPTIQVAVCEDRVHAVKRLAQQDPAPEVIILDDALQHRAIQCGLNILLTRYDNLYVHDHMLPWGELRDLPRRANKANIIVVTKCPDEMRPIDKRIIDNSLHLATFQHLFFSKIHYPALSIPGNPLIVTGIARPQYLIRHIQKHYPDAGTLIYPDHHPFSEKDVANIMSKAQHYACVVTTQKDWQRMLLTDLPTQLPVPLIVQPCEAAIDVETTSIDNYILTFVRERLHKYYDEKH